MSELGRLKLGFTHIDTKFLNISTSVLYVFQTKFFNPALSNTCINMCNGKYSVLSIEHHMVSPFFLDKQLWNPVLMWFYYSIWNHVILHICHEAADKKWGCSAWS